MINSLERPNSLPWPPIIFAGLVGLALALDYWRPVGLALPQSFNSGLFWTGVCLFVFGFALDFSTLIYFLRQRANFLPNRSATRLLTGGPFRLSRNPIYLGEVIMLLGSGLFLNSLWFIAAAALGALLVDRLAIRREERHLSAKFGQEWNDYIKRTGRWL